MPRSLARFLVAVVAVCVSATASAQTASSYGDDAAAQQYKPLAGYDDGFILRSADDAFSLQILSQLQFQHLYQDIRAAGAVDTNTFRMRRARFILAGKFFERFEFTTLVSHGTTS